VARAARERGERLLERSPPGAVEAVAEIGKLPPQFPRLLCWQQVKQRVLDHAPGEVKRSLAVAWSGEDISLAQLVQQLVLFVAQVDRAGADHPEIGGLRLLWREQAATAQVARDHLFRQTVEGPSRATRRNPGFRPESREFPAVLRPSMIHYLRRSGERNAALHQPFTWRSDPFERDGGPPRSRRASAPAPA
jgi:hypothetical protein